MNIFHIQETVANLHTGVLILGVEYTLPLILYLPYLPAIIKLSQHRSEQILIYFGLKKMAG